MLRALVLHLVISHTRQGVRFVTGIGYCGRSASCDITQKTGGTIFYGHWVLPLVIHTRDKWYDLLRALGFCVL